MYIFLFLLAATAFECGYQVDDLCVRDASRRELGRIRDGVCIARSCTALRVHCGGTSISECIVRVNGSFEQTICTTKGDTVRINPCENVTYYIDTYGRYRLICADGISLGTCPCTALLAYGLVDEECVSVEMQGYLVQTWSKCYANVNKTCGSGRGRCTTTGRCAIYEDAPCCGNVTRGFCTTSWCINDRWCSDGECCVDTCKEPDVFIAEPNKARYGYLSLSS